MKKINCYMLLFMIALFSFACQEEEVEPYISVSTFTDTRDGQEYQTVWVGHLIWMADNLNYKTEDSWWFNNDPSYGKTHGRLYTWNAALKACPSGWRLPTDQDWAYLMDYSQGNKKAYESLIEGGSSGFGAKLGGQHSPNDEFNLFGQYGLYWSATERGQEGQVWYYYFYHHYNTMYRYSGAKDYGYSCRCVRNEQSYVD